METPEYLRRDSTRVLVCTPSADFEGEFHHPPGVRLSDAIRNAFAADRHMLLTDVTITERGDDRLSMAVRMAPFILINGAHASVIVPVADREAAAAVQQAELQIVQREAA